MKHIPLVNLKRQYKGIKKEIDDAIKRVLNETSFIMGDDVVRFEKEFAEYLGVNHCVGVSSGTDALHLALLSLGVGKGDEVITTPHTFIATSEAITMCQATPVFVDIDPNSYNIDPAKIEARISKKTKAILPVHIYGQPAEMDPILKIAKRHNLFVLEDCAQAHGAEYKGKKVGTFGEVSIFSFYPGKNLGCYGDGGAVVTDNPAIAEKVRLLMNHGRTEKYIHQILGYGNRLDTIQAAVLRVKLRKLNKWNVRRQAIANQYNNYLAKLPLKLPAQPKNTKPVYHIYSVLLKNRDRIQDKLKSAGIESGIHYPLPLHLQPAFSYLGYNKGSFPVAEKVSRETLSLPIFPEMRTDEINYICRLISKFMA